MKHYYSSVRKHHKFIIHGEEIYIEYRPRLKMFDMIYYPNKGRMYGQSQYYDKFVCRNADFTALIGVIIKASEAYAMTSEHVRFLTSSNSMHLSLQWSKLCAMPFVTPLRIVLNARIKL